jgi:hypothetical protein
MTRVVPFRPTPEADSVLDQLMAAGAGRSYNQLIERALLAYAADRNIYPRPPGPLPGQMSLFEDVTNGENERETSAGSRA